MTRLRLLLLLLAVVATNLLAGVTRAGKRQCRGDGFVFCRSVTGRARGY